MTQGRNPTRESSEKKNQKKEILHENHERITQADNPTQENSEYFLSEVPAWPFSAIFSWVGLALGCEVRWFHIIFIRFSTQQNWVDRKPPNQATIQPTKQPILYTRINQPTTPPCSLPAKLVQLHDRPKP